jgi:hypothetical protein
VAELGKDTGEKLTALAKAGSAYAALGSAVLYLVGYLTLRFHLTTLGVATDLAVLDERYLFAGAQFLVYLVSAVPVVVLIGLVVSALGYAPYRVLAARRRLKRSAAGKDRCEPMRVRWSAPHRLALTGIVMSVAMIQVVMRQCFPFSNLLVAERLPQPEWLQALLLAEDDGLKFLYFTGLLVGTAGTAGVLLWARSRPVHTSFSRVLCALLTVLVAVQALLLPVNYGILVANKTLPRVDNAGASGDMPPGEAWLVWEGKDGITYLVRNHQTHPARRVLVTLRRSEVKQIQIIAYDPILRVLFAKNGK